MSIEHIIYAMWDIATAHMHVCVCVVLLELILLVTSRLDLPM